MRLGAWQSSSSAQGQAVWNKKRQSGAGERVEETDNKLPVPGLVVGRGDLRVEIDAVLQRGLILIEDHELAKTGVPPQELHGARCETKEREK